MPEAVFEIKGLTKVYRTGDVEVQALRGVDADLYRGRAGRACSAPSGSGKSTLLNILGGLDTRDRGHGALSRRTT